MFKYTHKTLRKEGNELYNHPEEYLGRLGFVRTNKPDASAMEFLRVATGKPIIVMHVSEGKPIDYFTGIKSRYISFEGIPEDIKRFINELERLVLPLDMRL